MNALLRMPISDLDRIAPSIYAAFAHNSVVNTTLSGITPGYIYVDEIELPKIIFLQFKHQCFLICDPGNVKTVDLQAFFKDEVIPNCNKAMAPLFKLFVNTPALLEMVTNQLSDLRTFRVSYQCYQYQNSSPIRNLQTPNGFELRIVDQPLVNEEFEGKQDLLDEMCSERESVKAFIENSFGIAAFFDQKLAGWCLSEYNHADRCEVGIATMPPFQRQGLAKAMTLKFLDFAGMNGISTVLWHCEKRNKPSALTALSAGFSLVAEAPVLISYF